MDRRRGVLGAWIRQTRLAAEEGQGLVEFAFGFVILMLILMGIADLGRAYYTYVALGNAAGEGAAYGSFAPRCPNRDAGANCAYPNNVTDRAKNESQQGLIRTDQIEEVIVETPNPSAPQIGDPVTVTIVYNYEFITPLYRAAGIDNIKLRAWAVQPVRAP